jgi:hypothetical protein
MRVHRLALLTLGLLLLPGLANAGPRYTSSSHRATSSADHTADQAFDGLLSTSWAEDSPSLGAGEWLQVDLGRNVKVGSISVWGGAFASREAWAGSGRLAEATLLLVGPGGEAEHTIKFGDRYARRDVSVDAEIRTLRITIAEVHEGSVFADTHIAEVAFDFTAEPDPAWQAAIDRAMSRSRSLRAAPEKALEGLEAAYQRCKNNEDYSQSFKAISAYAVRGPDYLLTQVQKYVPVGRRLPFLQFDEAAFDKLGRLKDANAIPYLEVAAAGSLKDADREWLFETVEFFKAYQNLRRTPRATVPNWGSTGMERGAFMGRGEPLSISVDSGGNVWVADVGNNRVQRLSPQGTTNLIIGSEGRVVAEEWFGDRGTPYASAATPGREPGQFVQPLHLTVGNYDLAAVIDAELRVQVFDGEGKTHATWQIDTPWRPEAGTGNGTPIVTWLGDDFYFLLGDEVFVYGAKGALKKRYHLEGGSVQCAVIAAGGKLLVRHVGEREIIEYNPSDGFRQGRWMKKGVPDDGSEDWDMATDEKDNLYVVTDAGKIYKWNKRGRFIKEIPIFENPRDMPRIAVFGAVIYVSAKDEIVHHVQDK